VQITVMTAFPGTPLYRRLRAAGRLIEENAWEKCTLFDVNFRPQHMSPRDLELGLIDLGRRFYSREAKMRRNSNFRGHMRQGFARRRLERTERVS
jgi:Domain of unknown function (DUF4070)